jgi:hypothetical protein
MPVNACFDQVNARRISVVNQRIDHLLAREQMVRRDAA